MFVWIDILDASGNRLGDGPITTATGWQHTRALDSAGTFSFSMPAADTMAAYVTNKCHVHCYGGPSDVGAWPDGLQDLGAGIVERIDLQPTAKGATMLRVSGSDLLSELGNQTVGDLDLFRDDVRLPTQVQHVVTGGSSTDWTPGATVNLQTDALSYLYIKATDAFFKVTFDLDPTTVNTAAATLQGQYMNGASSPQGWETLSFTDTTRTGGKPLAQDGSIEFDPPPGWRRGDGTGGEAGVYIIRLYCDNVDLSPVKIDGITVTVRKPTLTALQDVMALAPLGWSLDPTGKLVTEQHLAVGSRKGVYLQMNKQSVLATLGLVAEQTGEHFILSPSGRRVLWLGTDQRDSGLRAVGPADPGVDPDDFTFYIRHDGLKRTLDSYPLFTRIYVAGGGVGAERITLSDATDSAPAGTTMNTTEGWLQMTAAVAQYGRIDVPIDYPDIVAMDNGFDSQGHAGNTLLQRAYEELRRGSTLQKAYQIGVLPAKYRVYPGQKLPVSYHEWTPDGFHAVNIEETLWVLDVSTAVTATGDIYTVGLTVATVDTYPTWDSKRVAKAINEGRSSRSQKLPESGLTDNDRGEVAAMYVKNGKVTEVVKRNPITPIADGAYPGQPDAQYIYQITTQDGRITAMDIRDNV